MVTNVAIITFCKSMPSFYGNELVFKTLRIGFPKANISVYDNGSIPEARDKIKTLADKTGCSFMSFEESIPHWYLIEKIIANTKGRLVFIDPDIVFWANCDVAFDGLVAGRLLPRFQCSYTNSITMPRIHTSFMWIRDVDALSKAQNKAMYAGASEPEFFPSFAPVGLKVGGKRIRFDTGAVLYAALEKEIYLFIEKELNRYDHLFCGTHSIDIKRKIAIQSGYSELLAIHNKVMSNNIADIRGIWRKQKEYFEQAGKLI